MSSVGMGPRSRRSAAVLFLLASAALAGPPAVARAAEGSLHDEAVAALADTRAATAEIVNASAVTADDPTPFKRAAQRSINALVGSEGRQYRRDAGDPGDGTGALGHVERLLHRSGAAVWKAALRGAWVNETTAVTQLEKALAAKGLDDYQLDTTAALESLEVATGRDSLAGSLGGLESALATTELGVPDGARVVSGCVAPSRAPAYGIAKGYLVFVAVPTGQGTAMLPQTFGVRAVDSGNGFVVLRTAAASEAAGLCGHAAAARRTGIAAAGAPAADPAPKLYDEHQAEQGRDIYVKACLACHGAALQGASAPAPAGQAFLHKAEKLGWSVSDMRYLVVGSMPLNNPGSLSPEAYADVLSFLLASDCYPPGNKPFPTQDTATLKAVKLGPPTGAKAQNAKLGTCEVP